MRTRSDTKAPDPSRLHRPLGQVLRPLVRLLIRSGLTFPALCNLLRELYVQVAETEFVLQGKTQTDSRVSLLTGIHRKEVSRLRGAGVPVSDMPATLSRTSRIIARWLGGAPFSDAGGNPLPLPRTAEAGPSFDSLVTAVTRDVRPRAILDEWLDSGLAAFDAVGRVTLLQTASIPQPGGEQQLYYFGRNLHDHAAAAVSNVLGGQPPFMERAVHYGGLSEAAARALVARAQELAGASLQAANVEATRLCEGDGGGSWRWNYGVYVYAEPDRPAGEAAERTGGDAP